MVRLCIISPYVFMAAFQWNKDLLKKVIILKSQKIKKEGKLHILQTYY